MIISTLLRGCTLALLLTIAASRAPQPGSAAGTYRIAVCQRGSCSPRDTAGALVWGTLVLFDDSLDLASLSPQVRRKLTQTFAPRPLNACYVLHRRPDTEQTMAGIGGVSGTNWRPDRQRVGGLTLTLYASPDASHVVRARQTREGFRGSGVSSGYIFTEFRLPSDTVVAERIGPADFGICIAAAAAAAQP